MKKALIVIDFINEIVHPDGKISASAAYVKEKNVIAKSNELIAKARKENDLLIFVKIAFQEDYSDCPAQSPIFGKAKEYQVLKLNAWGTEFHEDLAINENDIVVVKNRVSALCNTELEKILRENNIEHTVLCGVSTDMAIQTTARELHDRDFAVSIVANACGARDVEVHAQSLEQLSRIAKIIV